MASEGTGKEVCIVGVGMGNPDTLTVRAKRVIEESGLLVGAARLLEPFEGLPCEKRALTATADVADAVLSAQVPQVAVLMSGDSGFFSGTGPLLDALSAAGVTPEVLPGVSSLSYLCSRLRVPWSGVRVVSAHGREANVAGEVQSHERTFVLTGGKSKAGDICRELCGRGLSSVRVTVGERLSYPDERIVTGTAEELAGTGFSDLAVLLVENPRPVRRPYAVPTLSDEEFSRSQAPMTKEEIRMLAMAKLRIRPADVVWDIGAGTGSTSVEAAFAASRGRVLAIEKNHEAIATLRRNIEKFGVSNVEVVEGLAPDVLDGLEPPDRVFVGGTSGRLVEIVNAALAKNPRARVVANGVTLEMARETLRCLEECALSDVEIVQASIAKSHELGEYHLMFARNPVLILSANGAARDLAADEAPAAGAGALA